MMDSGGINACKGVPRSHRGGMTLLESLESDIRECEIRLDGLNSIKKRLSEPGGVFNLTIDEIGQLTRVF